MRNFIGLFFMLGLGLVVGVVVVVVVVVGVRGYPRFWVVILCCLIFFRSVRTYGVYYIGLAVLITTLLAEKLFCYV